MPEDDPLAIVLGLVAIIAFCWALSHLPTVWFHLFWLLQRPRWHHHHGDRTKFEAAMSEYRYKHTMAKEKRNAEIARRQREEKW